MVEEPQIAGEVEQGILDPRIRRTRHMLHESLEYLLTAKRGIDKISVGDIAERATLNRATFYDHYPDKFALLEGLVASRFQDLLKLRGVVFDGDCGRALSHIIRATCDYLASLPGSGQCPERRQMEKHFETAIMAVVRNTILAGMRTHAMPQDLSPELIAATVSGAVYAGAKEWAQTRDRAPVEEIVPAILILVAPMVPSH